jgi:hypothetical protein
VGVCGDELGSVRLWNQVGDHWHGPVADATDRLSLLADDAGPDAFWRSFHEFLAFPRRRVGVSVSLWRTVAEAAVVWVAGSLIYLGATVGPFLGGNCGPNGGLFGPEGRLAGGGYDSGLAGVALGAGLLVATAIAAVRLPAWRGPLLLAFLILFPAALIVLWVGVAPAIWGPQHCVIP